MNLDNFFSYLESTKTSWSTVQQIPALVGWNYNGLSLHLFIIIAFPYYLKHIEAAVHKPLIGYVLRIKWVVIKRRLGKGSKKKKRQIIHFLWISVLPPPPYPRRPWLIIFTLRNFFIHICCPPPLGPYQQIVILIIFFKFPLINFSFSKHRPSGPMLS